MIVSSKSKPYALLIEESIRHSDELCRVLNSNTSQIGELVLELDHLITDYQDGKEIQDMTAESYHQRLSKIKTEAKKIDEMIGGLAKETIENMGKLLKILSRPPLSKYTLLGLNEIGYDICLIIQSEKALAESKKVVDVHHKYLGSRIDCYQSNKSRFMTKLSEAESKDLLKEKQSYYNWAFSWFSRLEKTSEPVTTLVLSTESPGWVKKLWNTKCSEIPELTNNSLMRTLSVLLSQKPYNSPKKESSLTSGMQLRPLNLARLKKGDLDGASIRETSSIKSPTSFKRRCDLMEESVDSQHSFYHSESVALKPPSAVTSFKVPLTDDSVLTGIREREESQSRFSSSRDVLTENNLHQLSLEQESEQLILTESSLGYHQINQFLQDDLQKIENTVPIINMFLAELEEKQNALIADFSKKQKNAPYEDEENARLSQFSDYLKQGVITYLNFKCLYNCLYYSELNLIRAYGIVNTWDLSDLTVQTLSGLRFPVLPILQIKELDTRAEILMTETRNKSRDFNALKSKLETKLNQAFYNLKWAKNELGFYERGSSIFSMNLFYLNEAVSLVKKEEKERNPSIVVMEDPFSF